MLDENGATLPPFVPADAGTQTLPWIIAAKERDARFRGHERRVV